MDAIAQAIEIKKRGLELPAPLVADVVADVARGAVADYRISALLMAIYIQGMRFEETVALTSAMAASGRCYRFPDCVDKHSTGGVGDKVSLCSLPLVAACGVPVAKLAGRGLNFTGGTIDKLEAIPGVSCRLSEDKLRMGLESAGIAIGEAGDAAPVDTVMYAIRDLTGTVDSLPLIASSVASKKVATGAGAVLYDVKCGAGAFSPTEGVARELAELLVAVSSELGLRTTALVTDMNQPLGTAVGNALEVREAVRFLRAEPVAADLDRLAREVAVRLLELQGMQQDVEAIVDRTLRTGAGYEKFRLLVSAQGGASAALDKLPISNARWEIASEGGGRVERVDARRIGEAALALGAGRTRKGESVLPGVGVELRAKAGDFVEPGEPLALVYGYRNRARVRELLEVAFRIETSG